MCVQTSVNVFNAQQVTPKMEIYVHRYYANQINSWQAINVKIAQLAVSHVFIRAVHQIIALYLVKLLVASSVSPLTFYKMVLVSNVYQDGTATLITVNNVLTIA